jgi:DNA-binding response OmpR family regulator
MNNQHPLTSGAFRLDPGNEQLWRGDASVPLTAKAFAVLHYLLKHAGQLITRDTLLEQVWGTFKGGNDRSGQEPQDGVKSGPGILGQASPEKVCEQKSGDRG